MITSIQEMDISTDWVDELLIKNHGIHAGRKINLLESYYALSSQFYDIKLSYRMKYINRINTELPIYYSSIKNKSNFYCFVWNIKMYI